MIIGNANSITLDQNPGTLPDMEDALNSWFQSMIFGVITKNVLNGQLVEAQVQTNFQGVWQPFSPQQLNMMPRGQRAWSWFKLHAEVALLLFPDDVVVYRGSSYRVMHKLDHSAYGYLEYNLVLAYASSSAIVTEDGSPITTEDGDVIITEGGG